MRTVKKIFILVLVVGILLSLLPAVHAGDVFACEVRNDGVWITGGQVSGDLVIPDEIDGRPVVGIARDAFSDRGAYITSVRLPDTLRYVEGNAFCACTHLSEPIVIPDGVEWIDPSAFTYTQITGKAHSAVDRYRVTSAQMYCTIQGDTVGYETILDNDNLYWVHGDEAELVRIGNIPEDDPTLVLPETVGGYPLTSIGPFCSVQGRAKIPYHLIVPGTVRTIRDYAFWNSNVCTVYLCEGVQTLGAYCLDLDDNYYSDKAVTLPRSVEQVDPHAFHHDLHSYCNIIYYAYRDSPAAQVAEVQRRSVVYRDGSDGLIYGVWGGLSFRIDGGNAEICERFSKPFSFAPDRIEDWPVTKLDLDGSRNDFCFYIPPGVTEITHDSNLNLPDRYPTELLHVAYPGSYGESYCRAHHRSYMSIYSYWGVPFEDTPENRWYYDAVCHCYHTGLMSGVSETLFAPNSTTSRSMLVTVLWRMAGCPEAEAPCTFLDVSEGTWYTDAVAWAQENGIVNGVGEGRFDPDGAITREQLATILCRYLDGEADARGLSEVAEFPDAECISPWALDAFAWAKTAGILKGQLSGSQVYLNPLGNTSRAELATVLARLN